MVRLPHAISRAEKPAIMGMLYAASYLLPLIVLFIVALALTERLGDIPEYFRGRDFPRGLPLLSALGITLSSLDLLSRDRVSKQISRVINVILLCIAMLILGQYVLIGTDQLSGTVVDSVLRGYVPLKGVASVATGLSLVFLAWARLKRLNDARSFSNVLVTVVIALSGTAILGFFYSVPDLHALFLYSHIALHTSISLFLLALTMSVADLDSGWAKLVASARSGGGPTRRQLSFCLLPIVAGGVLIRAVQMEALSYNAAIAALVIITVGPLIALVLRDGRTLDEKDAADAAHEQYRAQIAADLTLRLAAQAETLKREVDERRAAEMAMYRAQRMEAVGQLTGGIAHDFNNLLMTVRSNLHLLNTKLGPQHAGQIYTDRLTLATDRGIGLTSQLLAFSRIQKLNVQSVNLKEALDGARDLIGNALGPGVKIELAVDAGDVWVRADLSQLQLAILNLAINARDAMPNGGWLRISTSESVIEMVDGRAKQYAAIHVADNGTGMTPEVSARAIEPFFTTKEHGKGTGLGLAQVYGVVKQCGGELRIASEVSRGTMIDILLPLSAAVKESSPEALRSDANAPVTPVSRPDMSSLRPILLVDDDELVRVAVAEVLRTEGYEVIEAANGLAALGILETVTPAAAVIDFLMPGLNGAQVARAAQASLPDLPIIFVSGYADTIALDEITGAVILRKPVTPEELLHAVSLAVFSRC